MFIKTYLFQTIYPPNKPINEVNCERLTTIANKLNMFELIRRCEEFLIKNRTPTMVVLSFCFFTLKILSLLEIFGTAKWNDFETLLNVTFLYEFNDHVSRMPIPLFSDCIVPGLWGYQATPSTMWI